MNPAAKNHVISTDEVLEGELRSAIRHECLGGEVYAMASAGEKHNRISLNTAFHLRGASRGKACGVFINDMKLRIDASDALYHPDVLVSCDPADTQPLFKSMALQVPTLNAPAVASAQASMARVAKVDVALCPCCKLGRLHVGATLLGNATCQRRSVRRLRTIGIPHDVEAASPAPNRQAPRRVGLAHRSNWRHPDRHSNK